MTNFRGIADKYVGVPYGDGPGEFRCWDLLRAYTRDALGIELPSYDYDPHNREALAQLIKSKLSTWREVPRTEARASDAVLLWVAKPSLPSHVGIYLGGGEMLHTMEGFARLGQAPSPIGAVIERVDVGKWAARVSGYYRHESQFVGWTLRVRPHPFKPDTLEVPCAPGETILAALRGAGVVQDTRGGKVVVVIGDETIDAKWWGRIRPRRGVIVDAQSIPGDPVTLFFAIGGAIGSALIGTSASIAVPLAIAGGVLGSAAITAGLGFASQMLLSSVAGQSETGNNVGAVGPAASPAAQGVSNQLDPFGVVPIHYGTVKIFPPLAAPAFTTVQGADKYWNLILCVGRGRYEISNIEIGGVPIETMAPLGAKVEIIEGGTVDPYQTELLAFDPTDYWRMASGANEIGARPSLTAVGATLNSASITNDATAESALFDGANDYLTGTAPFTDLQGDWTACFWVTLGAEQDATLLQVGEGDPATGNGFVLRFDHETQAGTGAVVARGIGFELPGTGVRRKAVIAAPVDGRAFMVAIRRRANSNTSDGQTHNFAVHVDGQIVGNFRHPIVNGADFLTVGARKKGANYSEFFNGRISELAFFDTPLSDSRLAMLANIASSTQPRIDRRGPPLNLYNDTVLEVPLGDVFEPQGYDAGTGPIYENWSTRSIPGEVTELQADIHFPTGLYRMEIDDNEGDLNPKPYEVGFDLEYRLEGSGDGDWKKAGFSGLSEFQGQGSWYIFPGGEIAISGFVQREFLLGWRWPVQRGRYEMRWRGITQGQPSQRNGGSETAQAVGGYQVLAFRGIARGQEPVRAKNVSLIGLRVPVKETGSTIGQISCLARRQLRTVSGGVLSTAYTTTDNAAWAMLDALIGPEANARPIASSKIDLAAFEAFASRAEDCNLTVDFRTNVQDLANLIGSPSFASLGYNGQWTVIEDRAGLSASQAISPRNSRFIGGVIRRPDLPHALRVKYVDAAKGYQEREVLVYDDGYNEDGSDGLTAATKFEAIEVRGLTDRDLVRIHTRIRLAMARLRIEEWQVEMFLDHIRARRGSVVKFSHWAALIGQTSARVTARTTGGGGTTVTSFVVDEVLTYAGATNYGVLWRQPDGTIRRADVTNPGAGESSTITFSTPAAIATAPAVGDLVAFGIRNEETTEALVREVIRQPGFKAAVVLIPYAPTVFDAGEGPVAYDPIVASPVPYATARQPLAPAIIAVESDERFLVVSASGVTPRIRVLLSARNTSRGETGAVQVRSRRRGDVSNPGEPPGVWEYSDWDVRFPFEAWVSDVVVGHTYELQARAQTADGISSEWGSPTMHVVIGTSTPPPDVTDVRVDGDLISWTYPNPPSDHDGFKLRWVYGNPRDAAAVWSGAHQPHGGVLRGTTFPIAHIPRTNDQEVTVLVRAVDVAGNLSTTPARVLFTGLAEGSNIVQVLLDASAAGWPGVITNGTVSGDSLVADAYAEVPMFAGDAAPMFSQETTDDMFGDVSMPMTYYATVEIPAVSEGRRLFTSLAFDPVSAHPVVQWRTYGQSPMFPGDPLAPMFSEDDGVMFPLSGPMFGASDAPMFAADSLWPGPEWSEWTTWPGQIPSPQRRSYQWRVSVPSMPGGASLTRFRIYSDVPDLVETVNDVAISAEGSRLPLTKLFASVSLVVPILQSVEGQMGNSVRVVDYEAWGPMVEVIDETGARVEGLIDADVKGVPLVA